METGTELCRLAGHFHKTSYHSVRAYNRSMVSPSSVNDEQPDVIRVLNEYYSAFSTLKIEAILPYFLEPSLLIGPQGAYAATTHGLLATAISPAIEGLRVRGLGRTELIVRNIKLLSATSALVGGVAQRYKTDGDKLDQAGVTYVLYKAETGWKIAVLIYHPDQEP
jgi:hypothetical protein